MQKVLVEIKLLSDTIWGSGNSVPGNVDIDVLMDDCGFPFLKGKTFKGKLREEAENIWEWTSAPAILHTLKKLFGEPNRDTVKIYEGKLFFGDFHLDSKIREILKKELDKKSLGRQEIIDSLTLRRAFTEMENGVAKDKSLRFARAIRKGLVFYGEIVSMDDMEELDKAVLAGACSLLKYLGTMETRGFGQVEINLFQNNKPVLEEWLTKLENI